MPSVAFVADGHAEIGGGHVMRSLALAAALSARGADCAFLGGEFVEGVVSRYGAGASRWIETAPSGSSEYKSSVKAAVARLAPDVVVFDHYLLAADDHRSIADGRVVVLIDELIDRPVFADIVVDPTPQREAGAYFGLAQPGARFLMGPKHALLRPRFAAAREQGGRDPEKPVERILLTMGLTDLGGVTGRIAAAIGGELGDRKLDVVLDAKAASFPAVKALGERDPRVSVKSQVRDMAELMESADVCLGAGGGTTWERCALGLPTILTVIANNQRQYAKQVGQAKAAIVLDLAHEDYEAALVSAFRDLLRDGALRRSLSEASATLCDGRGAARVADAILERLAKGDDA